MKHIHKSKTSQANKLLEESRLALREVALAEVYDNFRGKETLNAILRKEQGGICCYCQQRLTHFQGDNNGGSHNEHFIPENGAYGRVDLQLDYFNLYACCNYTKDAKPSETYCGWHKKASLLTTNFLAQSDCSLTILSIP